MIIKWEAGELLYEKGCDSYDEGRAQYCWTAGSIDFDDYWFCVSTDKKEMLIRYDRISRATFWDRVNVQWYAEGYGYESFWSPKAREIYEELMLRLRNMCIEGKGMGHFVGAAS